MLLPADQVTEAHAVVLSSLATSLWRSNEDVFGRAYGLALPASIGGIVLGSLIAPGLVTALGGSRALVVVGTMVLAYALVVLREARPAPVPALA